MEEKGSVEVSLRVGPEDVFEGIEARSSWWGNRRTGSQSADGRECAISFQFRVLGGIGSILGWGVDLRRNGKRPPTMSVGGTEYLDKGRPCQL